MRIPVSMILTAALLLAPGALAQKTSTTPSSATTMPTKTMPAKPTGTMNMAKVNINTATAADLAKLPGVSAKIAADIIKSRPYKDAADLVAKVKGIGPKNVKKMESMLSF